MNTSILSAKTSPTSGPRLWRISPRGALLTALLLGLLFAALRGVGNLGPLAARPLLPLGFVLMALTPWLLMTREGRIAIGFRRVPLRTLLTPCLAGAAAALFCFALGWLLYGNGDGHWFVSIARNFRNSVPHGLPTLALFFMFTIPAMLFSPIGEEIFFRGLLQQTLNERFGSRAATWGESLFFGVVHLCHHGLLWVGGALVFAGSSALIWVVLMTFTALLFARIRAQTGSLYPAMAAHAVFNLTMSMCIFAALWPTG